MELLQELLTINEASTGGRAWEGRIKHIDNLMSWMYDKGILTKTEQASKDVIFRQYYRFYNDGDLPRALANKGFSKHDMKYDKKKIEKALEDYLEDFIKKMLGKYLPKIDRKEFRIDNTISDLSTVKDVAERADAHGLLTYWIKSVKINDEAGDLAKYVNDLQKIYDSITADMNKISPKDSNYISSYRRDKMKEADVWTPALETKYNKLEGLTNKIAVFIGDLIEGLKKLKKNSVFKEDLNEMAASHKFSSGFMKTSAAKEMVSLFRAGKETFDLKNGDSYKAVKKRLQGNMLEAGMLVMGSYNSTNQGADLYQILGFTGDEEKYGSGGVKFKSAKELLTHYKVSSLKALETLQDKNEYGYHSYIVVRDLEDGDEGPWFYPYNGNWVRGSGAEKLTFTLIEKV